MTRPRTSLGQPIKSSASFRSRENIRLEIQFHQPNKIVNALIHSEIHLQMTANEGIRKTCDAQIQDITEPEAFFPIAKNPAIVHAVQLAVIELLRQPEGLYPS